MDDGPRKDRLNRLGYGIGGGLAVGSAVWVLSGTWWWLPVFLAVGLALGLFLRATTPGA